MRLTITLSPEAVAAVAAQTAWQGTVEARLEPAGGPFCPDTLVIDPSRSRLAGQARRDARSSAHAASAVLSPSEMLLIDAWNDSQYVREHHASESRNQPLRAARTTAALPLIRKALQSPGLNPCLVRMAEYLDACADQRHVQAGRNVGYKDLTGFLKAVIVQANGGQDPWWSPVQAGVVPDDRPDLTEALADAYAARWLGRERFGLANPSSDYTKFRDAAARVATYADHGRLEEKEAVRRLLDALADAWGPDKLVPVGSLGSDHTWKVVLPAYLKRLYG